MLVGVFLLVGVVLIAKPPSIFGAANSTYDVIGKILYNINGNINGIRLLDHFKNVKVVNENESNFQIFST